jgi:hypothetical protein
MSYDAELELVPDFPRTQHLPLNPNAQRDDLIASMDECREVFEGGAEIYIEEKVDAANVGFSILGGEPVIRNRNYILRKGYGRKNTPAKLQYAPIWTWFYENKYKFELLEEWFGFMPSVYGEWMYARHTIAYNKLPDWFLLFDIFDPIRKKFISPERYYEAAEYAGFHTVPMLAWTQRGFSKEDLLRYTTTEWKSKFDDESNIEGVYVKVVDASGHVSKRFKMVRPGFIPGVHWNKGGLVKNVRIR